MVSLFEALSWTRDSNIYEVNLRQYTKEGTCRAFEKELPRLKDMGVEILWFMPITPISIVKRLGSLGSYYACSDYQALNPEFGTLEDFTHLVSEAHGMGFKVIIDWVANHTGWDHRWTKEYPGFYKRNAKGQFYDTNGWMDVIDLDFANPDLRREMIESMRFWIQAAEIDGFRCDMAMLVPLDFWEQARTTLDGIKKLFWFAECEEPSYHKVFDASYAWRFLHKMEAYWRRETGISGLLDDLSYYQKDFLPTAMHAFFTTNHDENSHSGSEYERMGDAALAFAVFCCTWNGIPLIYSGQELPNRKRLKFFDKDQIEWTGHNDLHGFFKTLLTLRKRNKAMRSGDLNTSTRIIKTGVDKNIFCFIREGYNSQVLVILNLSDQPITFLIREENLLGSFRSVFEGDDLLIEHKIDLELPGWGYKVFEKLS